MAKYMIRVSYAAEGTKGLIKDGGSGRARVAEELIKSLGGKMEAFYFAFGDDDAYVIVDAPDNVSVAAASLGGLLEWSGCHKDDRAHHSGGDGRGHQENGQLSATGKVVSQVV